MRILYHVAHHLDWAGRENRRRRPGWDIASWRLVREFIRALVKEIDMTTQQFSVVLRIGS